MPTIDVSLADLNRLAGLEGRGLSWWEGRFPLCKAELKAHDPATGALRVELNDTNRPDLWTPEGIARQVRCYEEERPRDYPFFSAGKGSRSIEVDAALQPVRPIVGGFRAHGVAVTDEALVSLIQTQEKLAEHFGRRRKSVSIGVYRADVIRFPVRYRGVAPEEVRFVPLGFEEPMTLAEILTRHPKGIEYRGTLEGQAIYPLLTDADGEVLSFPPIINSRRLGEVRPGDADLFVEATGSDVFQVYLALNILAVDLADRGYAIEPVTTRFPYPTPLGQEVRAPYPFGDGRVVPVEAFERLLGMPTEAQVVVGWLGRYGVRAEVLEAGRAVRAVAPAYRLDHLHPVDVIEDYAIARTFDAFPPAEPPFFTVGKTDATADFADRLREGLVGAGFEEIVANVLVSRVELRERMRRTGSLVEIENPMTESYSVVRDSILPTLLRVEAASAKAGYPHRIFEVGEVAIPDAVEPHGSRNAWVLGLLIAAPRAPFSEGQAVLAALLYDLGVEAVLAPAEDPRFIDGRAGRILVNGKDVGVIGEIHPEVLLAWGIRNPVSAVELDVAFLRAAL